jgi:hypothetical protein
MIFSISNHIQQIIRGTKTQTRRIQKLNLTNLTRFQVGASYSIQPGRGKYGIPEGRIKITEIRMEKRGERISMGDARAEGGYMPERFEQLFSDMYPKWERRSVLTFIFVPTFGRMDSDGVRR